MRQTRKTRRSTTELDPLAIHDKLDHFESKLHDIKKSSALKACLGSGIKRAFVRMAYSETYDPVIEPPPHKKNAPSGGSAGKLKEGDGDAVDRQVREFRVDRMLTGQEKVIEECEKILD